MDEVARALAALERLERSADEAPAATPEELTRFSLRAPSPLAPERVEVVAGRADAPAFALPPASLASPRSAPGRLQERLSCASHPRLALERIGTFPEGRCGFFFPSRAPTPSRLLAQMPMRAPRTELAPARAGMVLRPLELQYAFRAADEARAGADAGFWSALSKQDEYARGRMSNKPFAPGGSTLATPPDAAGGPVVEGADALRGRMAASAVEQQRNALATAGDASLLEDEARGRAGGWTVALLDALVTDLPATLGRGLTVQDAHTIARFHDRQRQQEAVSAAKDEDEEGDGGRDAADEDEGETNGTNPPSLLQPYMEVAGDAAHVAAIRSAVLDDKAASAMRATGGESASVGLDQLLRDLEDDGDLAELGFSVDQVGEEAGGADATDAEQQTRPESGDAPAAALPEPDERAAGAVEPEEELEALLTADTAARRVPKASSEWASLASVDVRNFHDKVPEMAMRYAFELDTFQKECVLHLERHECVFVAAHTSAGKTVVAEYAIALSQKHMTRAIYTSPIKALSNQKYRDFRATFGADHVGLITGDVSINPDASCLVMTTEILRSMLYRGADVVRDIEWVVFDEIHYINDSERGVVWEEVIIMLPEHIGMVFLSATTPNHLEFSDWIGRTKKKKIHVISTLQRPVPLEHFLYAGKELFKVYDAASGYLPGAYTAAKNKLFPPPDKTKAGNATGARGGRVGRGGRGGGAPARGGGSTANARSLRTSGGDQSEWTRLVQSLKEQALLPVVVFAFSKRLCEESASKLSKLDLSSPAERSEIHLFLEASVQRLQGSDRELPQVLAMKEMLKRGVGVHHGGLLPILKEMVEMLFGRGLVKVLFSTETFAMGVNMPARTVVFNGTRKHDGKGFRDLLPGEYTQMAGRAGRRGLDAVGTVIIACWGDVPEPTALRTMLAGKATTLTSQFRLTYNMMLNLLRVEVLTVEDMMKRSFSEFHTQKALASRRIPQLIARGRELLARLEQALVDEFPHLHASGELEQLRAFYELQRQKRALERQLTAWVLANDVQAAKAAVAPGRVVALDVKGLRASHPLGIVVRTAALSGDAAAARAKMAFDAAQAPEAADRRVFKSITVVCLCPEDFEPPQPEAVADTKKSAADRPVGMSSAFGAPLRSKRDEDDALMRGRGKKGGYGGGGEGRRGDKDGAGLEAPATGSILGHTYAVLELPESCVESVTALEATGVNTKALAASGSRKELASAVELLAELDRRSGATLHASVPLVDVVGELRVHDLEVATGFGRWQDLFAAAQQHPMAAAADGASSQRGRVLRKLDKLDKLRRYVSRLARELSSDALSLFPDFQQRLSVLRRLGYVSADGVVQVKGRVACEVNTCDELVLTEMVFENVLAALEPEEIAAVLSALIFQEKTQAEPTLTPRLEAARDAVQRIAASLGVVQLEQRLDVDPAAYARGALNFGLAEVVYEWARGMPFTQLCQLTDVQEGSIVRCITRLDEVCREVRNAARVVGDPALFRKMEVASEAIKRDVVFASSLYLT